jgi:hypothetical protein
MQSKHVQEKGNQPTPSKNLMWFLFHEATVRSTPVQSLFIDQDR